MSKIERYAGNLRAFGSNAQGLERTLFGETAQADDLTSQVTAAFLRGWGIVGPSENPSLEDFNAAMYAMSQFIAYQHQMGIPEWDAAQEYYTGSLCVRGGETYSSLSDDNIGSAPPSAKWTPVLTSKNGLANLGLGEIKLAGVIGGLIAGSGHVDFPVIINGVKKTLILQWGSFGNDATGDSTVSFPIPFPNAVRQVFTSAAVSGTGAFAGYNSITKSGFKGNLWASLNQRQSGSVSYLALGE